MSITKLNNLSVSALTALPSGLGGKVLQVVQTTKTTSFSTSSTSYTDLTGFSVTITPSSTANYILLLGSYNMGADNTAGGLGYLKFLRGSTDLLVSTDSGTYSHAYSHHESNDAFASISMASQSICIFDTPSSISALTYKAQARTNDATNPFIFNRGGRSDTNTDDARRACQLIAIEIAG